ncbi:MAG TPA: hypothetical protein VNX26_03365 [Candidatus Acidoferrum sp.]|jgi:hypothetical protein|nr:hypothetical protein [Candidatus Acidoferrum sp.]
MTDIGPVLRERLKTIASERARLDQMEAGIKALLQLENQGIAASGNGGSNHSVGGGNTHLANFVLDTLKQKRSVTVNDLKSAAEKAGIDFGEKSPGRVIHWTLVAKQRSGIVEKVNGKWRFKEATQ